MQCKYRFDKFFEVLALVGGVIFIQLCIVFAIDIAGYLGRQLYLVIAYFSLTCIAVAVYGRFISVGVLDLISGRRSRPN